MKVLKYVFKFFLFSSVIYFNHLSAFALTVPFQNILLNANRSLTANYSFGSNGIIFCYTDSLENTGTVAWTFKGKPQSGVMPITLVTSNNFQGSLADPKGTLTVTNTLNIATLVSCQFAF